MNERHVPDAAVASVAVADPWADLRRHTPARIALGRAGTSLPLAEVLKFSAAHAQARDAVHVPLDVTTLAAMLPAQHAPPLVVSSRAPDRHSYLRRPDWGRRLDTRSVDLLQAHAMNAAAAPVDVAVVLADGLSAVAAQRHGAAVLAELYRLLSGTFSLAPWVIATQSRVALGDEIGQQLKARLVLVLLGERPGLSSPDSLGAYLTHAPRIGCTDAQRNCVSNIRPEGLHPVAAAQRLAWLVREALRRGVTGIALKDDSLTELLV